MPPYSCFFIIWEYSLNYMALLNAYSIVSKKLNAPGKPETIQNQKICPTLLKELLYCCDLETVGMAFCWWANSGHLVYAFYGSTCMVTGQIIKKLIQCLEYSWNHEYFGSLAK